MLDHRIGTAGWAIPASERERFPGAGSRLERYAGIFSCVEINSTFHRPHRRGTYERWAQSVPETFRFALKVPKEITHRRHLIDVAEPLRAFLETSAELGPKRDVLLVQLPPSFVYDAAVVGAFFEQLRRVYPGRIACEPRHATWFDARAGAALEAFGIALVEADPPAVQRAGPIVIRAGFRYMRLHGAPRTYYSPYAAERLERIAREMATSELPVWCLFDNTASGAATSDALVLAALYERLIE